MVSLFSSNDVAKEMRSLLSSKESTTPVYTESPTEDALTIFHVGAADEPPLISKILEPAIAPTLANVDNEKQKKAIMGTRKDVLFFMANNLNILKGLLIT